MEIKNKRKIYCYQCLHFQRTEIPSDDNYGNTMFTVLDEDICCHIYVTPFDEAGDFHYQLTADML